MKQLSLLTLLLFCLLMTSYGKSRDTISLALGVEKEMMTHRKLFVFKPERSLKIKAKDGNKYHSSNYFFTDNYIVMKQRDTIYFENIKSIQGKIYGDGLRKTMGVVIALAAVPSGALAVFVYTFGGGSLTVAAAPFVGIIYGGIRLTGSRRFRLEKGYTLRVIRPQTKPLALTN